ncbi:DUF3348 family protein [Piscinibacter sakaiensis]|uniref:DUF3348 family protein n=1 Tax=Piscinibacter sakaiensis TaxID=1547922 RepID=UPI003AAB8D4B
MPQISRTSFNQSQLVRLLSDLQVAEVADSPQTVAERLSQWVGWTDSIAVADILAGLDHAPPRRTPRAGSRTSAADDAARLRADLARDISADPLLADADAADRASCRACYLAHQQSMQGRITALRDKLRTTLALRSAELGQLAALDAAFERALAARERQSLGAIPALLDKAFAQAPAAGSPDAIGPTMQRLLLAELELRMSPIDGMIDALAEQAGTPS